MNLKASKISPSNKGAAQYIFLEQSHHGLFRESPRNTHAILARQALSNITKEQIRVFHFDILSGFWGNTVFWLRFFHKLRNNKQEMNIILYFSIQNLKYLNPLLINKMCKSTKSSSLVCLSDSCWAFNKRSLRFYEKYFHFASLWDEYNVKEEFKIEIINFSFGPFPNQIIAPPSMERKYDVSFVGKTNGRQERRELLSKIKKSNLSFFIKTETDIDQIPTKRYYEIMKDSKVVLNFNDSNASKEQILQFKGRTIEALLCGSVLLESDSGQTKRIFNQGTDYFSFGSLDDLNLRLQSILENYRELGLPVAINGHKKVLEKFTGEKYWKMILARVKKQ